MARLEEITIDCNVTGLSGKGAVTIASVKWHGNSVMEVVFKDSAGQLGEQMLYREDEASLGIQDSGLPWTLTPMPIFCGWHRKPTASILLIFSTTIWPCILLTWSASASDFRSISENAEASAAPLYSG